MGYKIQLAVVDPKTKEIMERLSVTLYCEYAPGDTFTMVENGKHYVYKVLEPMTMLVEEQSTDPMPRHP